MSMLVEAPAAVEDALASLLDPLTHTYPCLSSLFTPLCRVHGSVEAVNRVLFEALRPQTQAHSSPLPPLLPHHMCSVEAKMSMLVEAPAAVEDALASLLDPIPLI